MTQKTAFTVATLVTSFLLVAVGAVTASIATQPATAAPAAAPAATELSPTATFIVGVDPAVVAEREAQYQQAIAQANQQLQLAYLLQKNLADDSASQPANTAPKSQVVVQAAPTHTPTQAPYPISPEMAVSIALGAAPGAIVTGLPELVLFQGVVVYEVVLDRGKIYIDANTGAVLYNATSNPSSGGGGSPSVDSSSNNNSGSAQPSTDGDDHGGDDHDHSENESEQEHHSDDHGDDD